MKGVGSYVTGGRHPDELQRLIDDFPNVVAQIRGLVPQANDRIIWAYGVLVKAINCEFAGEENTLPSLRALIDQQNQLFPHPQKRLGTRAISELTGSLPLALMRLQIDDFWKEG